MARRGWTKYWHRWLSGSALACVTLQAHVTAAQLTMNDLARPFPSHPSDAASDNAQEVGASLQAVHFKWIKQDARDDVMHAKEFGGNERQADEPRQGT